MIRISPSRVLIGLDGEPMRTGEIKDRKLRLQLAEMKDAALKATAEQCVLLERYEAALIDAQSFLTLGSVIISALQALLPGDDKVEAKAKVGRDDLCMSLYRAEREGETVDLSAEQIVEIKARVAQLFNPRVVGQVVRCLEGKDAEAATA